MSILLAPLLETLRRRLFPICFPSWPPGRAATTRAFFVHEAAQHCENSVQDITESGRRLCGTAQVDSQRKTIP